MAIDVIPDIAQRYRISLETARRIHESLSASCGQQCDFICPELGGRGHWTPGNVTGCAGLDPSVRARVDGLCCELAAIIRGCDTSSPEALSQPPGTMPSAGRVDLAAGESWWPASFGHSAFDGECSGLRYAWFPAVRRLLVQHGARIDAYDTGEYALAGLAKVQGQPSSLTFNSNRGPVHLDQFRPVPVA